MRKTACGLIVAALSLSNVTYADNGGLPLVQQQGKRITGTVVDDKGEAIIGANVVVKGTAGSGTITDIDGVFTLNVPSGAVLTVSYIGYVSQDIAVGNKTNITVTLIESTREVSEVVVTALGMKREEKALGYAVQKIGGEQFEKVKGAFLGTSLTGRISGLSVYNSTEFMETPSIRLRGENTLVVVNGVPTNQSLADFNQDNIESIDVLKGATASALYGSRGGNGAIMITTKKGGAGKGFSVEVNTSNMFNLGELAIPDVQKSYSAGYGGKYNTDDEVWGDKLDIGRMYEQWDPVSKSYKTMELTSKGRDNFKNFLEFSMVSNTTLSITQNGENGSFRTSFSYLYDKNQYPNTYGNKFWYTLGGEMKLGKKVSIEGTLNFAKQMAPNTAGTGYGNQGYIYNILVWTGPEWNINECRDYWLVPDEVQNWHYKGWYDNPWLMAYEKLNTIDNNTTNGTFALNFEIAPWLKARWNSGGYLYLNQTQKRAPKGIYSQRNWGSTDKGFYEEAKNTGYMLNSDFLLIGEKKFGQLSIDGILGASVYLTQTSNLYSSTRNGLSIPGFYSLKASVESPNVATSLSRKQVNSLLGKLTLGYMNAFYLDLTGRNDWSSTLPKDDNSYFYPSAGGSIILSELLPISSWTNNILGFTKIRGSWTVSKTDLDVYAINQAYSVSNSVWNGLNSASYPTTIRGNVAPVSNRTWETGLSLYFLKGNRLRFDLAYFDKLNYNNTASVTTSSASGYNSKLTNTNEEFARRGWEFTLDAIPVQTNSITWNSIINLSTSKRYRTKLDETYSPDNLWTFVGARADAYTYNVFERDPSGNIILYNGVPRQSNYQSVIGYSDPNWIWGFSNSIKYKDFVFSLSIDGRIGGLINSSINRRMWQTGAHPDTDNKYRYDEVVNGNKTPFLAEGVKIVSGEVKYDQYGRITSDTRVFAPNDVYVSYESYIKNYWRSGEQLVLDATFLKVREMSVTYNVPKKISSRLGASDIALSLIGQNLLLWTKEYRFADPDRNEDDLPSPSVRYVGFNLNVKF
jgi:TonB-linked SusC/RagA family outer membrane protein